MNSDDLREEFRYYLEHQDEIVERYDGKVVAIRGECVVEAFNSEVEAVTEMQKRYELGTFLIQRVSEGNEAYTQTFHSRLRIS